MTERIGIFGGSFDPIHNGHLLLAELCRERLELDQVRFVVANVSPFKTDKPMASNKDRIEMVKLAIGGNPRFQLDTSEVDRGGVSYTIDTVTSIASSFPNGKIYLLMGADVLVDIAKWREPKELFLRATPCVIARGGVGEPNWEKLAPFVDPSVLQLSRECKVDVPQIEISSTDLKRRLKNGLSIRYQVPPAVAQYIAEHSIYR